METQPPDAVVPDAALSGPALTPAQFHILLTLAEGERHGYGIMQEIRRRTDGAVELGPGTLYRSIKQLLALGFIVELDNGSDPGPDSGKKRRPYALTPLGKAKTADEAKRVAFLARWAEEALALEGGQA